MDLLEFQEYTRRMIIDLIKQSDIEYNEFEKRGEEVYLRQSVEKLFNATERVVEYFSKQKINFHIQFRERARIYLPDTHQFNKQTIRTLILKADVLHRFFYGGIYEETIPNIKEYRKELRDYLREIEEKLE